VDDGFWRGEDFKANNDFSAIASDSYLEENRYSHNVIIGGKKDFNNFIHDSEVEDIPFIRRRYTCGIDQALIQ